CRCRNKSVRTAPWLRLVNARALNSFSRRLGARKPQHFQPAPSRTARAALFRARSKPASFYEFLGFFDGHFPDRQHLRIRTAIEPAEIAVAQIGACGI